MEILSFYAKGQTLRSYFDQTLGWVLFIYASILFPLCILACLVTIYQYAGMRLSWVTGSFIYVVSQALVIKFQRLK